MAIGSAPAFRVAANSLSVFQRLAGFRPNQEDK
jgi:hypothetical protein